MLVRCLRKRDPRAPLVGTPRGPEQLGEKKEDHTTATVAHVKDSMSHSGLLAECYPNILQHCMKTREAAAVPGRTSRGCLARLPRREPSGAAVKEGGAAAELTRRFLLGVTDTASSTTWCRALPTLTWILTVFHGDVDRWMAHSSTRLHRRACATPPGPSSSAVVESPRANIPLVHSEFERLSPRVKDRLPGELTMAFSIPPLRQPPASQPQAKLPFHWLDGHQVTWDVRHGEVSSPCCSSSSRQHT